MSPNRVVAVLTPLVFAPLAGAIAAWLAENVPGADVSSDQLTGVFITGALIAFGKSAQWLHGWQKWEEREAAATAAADQADATTQVSAAPLTAAEPVAVDDFGSDLRDGTLDDELFNDADLLVDDDSLLADPLLDGEPQTAPDN
jgi:hypothetical protein